MMSPSQIITLNLVALKTLLMREIVRFMRIWTQTLLPPAITVSLYFVIFGRLIGSQLKPIHGFDYIQYIVPGLIMMSIMMNAYSNTSYSFYLTKFNRSIEEMLVAPMSSIIILLGFVLGGALRGIIVGILVFFIAFLFTDVPLMHPFITLSMAILASLLFSIAGLLNGIFAKNFDDVGFVPTFILTPLTYLGGVFFSISLLPPPWQHVALVNPILSIVETFRYGMLGTSDVSIGFGFSLVICLLIAMFILSGWLLAKGVRLKA